MCALFHPGMIKKMQKHFLVKWLQRLTEKPMRSHQNDCGQGACLMYSAH